MSKKGIFPTSRRFTSTLHFVNYCRVDFSYRMTKPSRPFLDKIFYKVFCLQKNISFFHLLLSHNLHSLANEEILFIYNSMIKFEAMVRLITSNQLSGHFFTTE